MLAITVVMVIIAFVAGVQVGETRMKAKAQVAIDGHKLITNALFSDMGKCIADAMALQDEKEELVDQINAMNAVFEDMMESQETVRIMPYRMSNN